MPLHSTDIEDRVIESAGSELVKTVKVVASDLEAQGLAGRELTSAVRKICKPVVASGYLSDYTIENELSDALLAAGLQCNARTDRKPTAQPPSSSAPASPLALP